MSLLSIFLAAGVTISCGSIKSGLSHEPWEAELCNKYFSEFTGVELKPIRTTRREAKESTPVLAVEKPKAGRVLVKRRVRDVKSGSFVEVSTYYVLTAYAGVWIAKKDIRANTVIKKRWAEYEYRNVASYLGIEQLVADSPVGFFTEQPIKKGNMFFLSKLKKKPLVQAGESIGVLIKNGDIRIQTRGIAVWHVYTVGETVDVRIKETGKVISGEIDENSVVHYNI